ncbi:MAG: allantoicase [Thermoleophilia bacterium]|nr:allantoicase [Thermoleophilia bacterium]
MSSFPLAHLNIPPIVRAADPLPADAPAFTSMIDLASELLGGTAIACSDDFFAEVGNLVRAENPVFVEHLYTDVGKWMDGWESRRRRIAGHDWAVVKLGAAGVIAGVDVDTAHFLGNAPASVELEITWAPDAHDDDFSDGGDAAGISWTQLVPDTSTLPGAHNLFASNTAAATIPATHVRVHMRPDGGIARLRVYGTVARTFAQEAQQGSELELSCATLGGRAIGASDEFFCDRGNLVLPGNARTMGEGWETRRRRGPGDRDWIIVALAAPTRVERLLIDTSHYKGNYPDTASIDAVDWRGRDERDLLPAVNASGTSAATGTNASSGASDQSGPSDPSGANDAAWRPLLTRTKLDPDAYHVFDDELVDAGIATHLRLSIFPDGGIARLRAFGVPIVDHESSNA